jgi:hypothetical protein
MIPSPKTLFDLSLQPRAFGELFAKLRHQPLHLVVAERLRLIRRSC